MPVPARYNIWAPLLLGIGLVGALCLPIHAQAQLSNERPGLEERERHGDRLYDRQTPGEESGVESLPSWAEPSNSAQGRRGSRGKSNSPPPPPPPPPSVPVDGGVFWLLVVGSGYGVHKLLASDETIFSGR